MRQILAQKTDIVCPVISGFDSPTNLIKVTPESRKAWQKAVHRIGNYFRLEVCEYDDRDERSVDFLWLHPAAPISKEFRIPIVGACSFVEDKCLDPVYSLHWVWIHPYWRRHGFLARALPTFRQEFGEFNIISPLSPAMCEFVKKHNLENYVI